jgi:hypothetical protein
VSVRTKDITIESDDHVELLYVEKVISKIRIDDEHRSGYKNGHSE